MLQYTPKPSPNYDGPKSVRTQRLHRCAGYDALRPVCLAGSYRTIAALHLDNCVAFGGLGFNGLGLRGSRRDESLVAMWDARAYASQHPNARSRFQSCFEIQRGNEHL